MLLLPHHHCIRQFSLPLAVLASEHARGCGLLPSCPVVTTLSSLQIAEAVEELGRHTAVLGLMQQDLAAIFKKLRSCRRVAGQGAWSLLGCLMAGRQGKALPVCIVHVASEFL